MWRRFRAIGAPNALDPLVVHVPALDAQQGRDPPIAIAAILTGQMNDRGGEQFFIIGDVRLNVVRAALAALKHIYREALAYKRGGVMLLDLVEAGQAQVSLFDTQEPRDDKLIEAFDAINDRLGPGTIQFGPPAQAAAWRSSNAFRSSFYTTRWEDIPKVKT